ncbi:hypothetical protein VTN77DRAFT_4028 [Rasamsonia byssochlamydoides]|uniref:uncharacterized protein n=1 Tax=Rasamsonia byssochlamydoides TaxID=89139 RepID=UPI0037434A30
MSNMHYIFNAEWCSRFPQIVVDVVGFDALRCPDQKKKRLRLKGLKLYQGQLSLGFMQRSIMSMVLSVLVLYQQQFRVLTSTRGCIVNCMVFSCSFMDCSLCRFLVQFSNLYSLIK